MSHESCCHCIYQGNAMPCSTKPNTCFAHMLRDGDHGDHPSCVWSRKVWGDVLDTSNAHASAGKSTESGLGTGAGGLGAVTTSGADLDMQGRYAELLAAGG